MSPWESLIKTIDGIADTGWEYSTARFYCSNENKTCPKRNLYISVIVVVRMGKSRYTSFISLLHPLTFASLLFSKFLVMFSTLPIKEDQRNREARDIKYPRQVAIFGNKSTMYKVNVWLSTRTLYFRVVSNLIASRKGDDVQTMVKLSKLLVVNVCIFVLFLIQAVTGGWIWIDILSGARPPLVLLRLHPYTGIVLTVFILMHIYLNWRWVKVQLLNQKLWKSGRSSKWR